MEFLNSLFGARAGAAKKPPSDADKLRAALNGLDIPVAVSTHENLKNRLHAYQDDTISNKLNANVVCFDDRCNLGKWIHSSGKAQLGRYPGFTALVSHHKMFHFAASNIVALQHRGKTAEADAILNGQFAQFSNAMVSDLQALGSMTLNQQ